MNINLDELTKEELVDLNHRIVERLKFFDSVSTYTEMMQFKIGEKVSFQGRGEGEVVGVIVKYNRKTVSVLADNGQRWNVSPHLLSSVAEKRKSRGNSDNIIEFDST